MSRRVLMAGKLAELMAAIPGIVEPDDGLYTLYTPCGSETLNGDMDCAIILYLNTDADDYVPRFAKKNGLEATADLRYIQHIIEMAYHQKADVSVDELIAALEHWIEYDGYMDFDDGRLPKSSQNERNHLIWGDLNYLAKEHRDLPADSEARERCVERYHAAMKRLYDLGWRGRLSPEEELPWNLMPEQYRLLNPSEQANQYSEADYHTPREVDYVPVQRKATGYPPPRQKRSVIHTVIKKVRRLL